MLVVMRMYRLLLTLIHQLELELVLTLEVMVIY